ncbi:hypothetical protein [Desulfonema magnum]|uniref:hypothetical protein n=1 Tax=Desulfonema magnum TaxID=45655 RepID=UPI00307EE245
MFDRPFVQRFDWCLFGLMFLLGCMGLVVLYSAVTAGSDAPRKLLVVRQVLWYGAGGVLLVFFFCVSTSCWSNGPM